jgi:hypothetical protein
MLNMPRSSIRRSSSSTYIIPRLKHEPAVLGPDCVPAWEDLSNVGRLCSVCRELFEVLKRIVSMSPEDQDGIAIRCSCWRGRRKVPKIPAVCLLDGRSRTFYSSIAKSRPFGLPLLHVGSIPIACGQIEPQIGCRRGHAWIQPQMAGQAIRK